MTYSRSKYLVVTLDYVMPLLLFFGSLIFTYIVFFSPLFTVKTIVCTQDFEPCNNPFILAEAETLKGKNIFLLNGNKFVNLLTTGDFQTRSGEIKKDLPTTLTISLQSVYPILALHVQGETRYATLDSNLSVLKLLENNPHVPVIELNSPLSLQIGHPIPDETFNKILRYSVSIIRGISDTSEIKISGDDLILTLNNGLQLVLTIHRDIAHQISALKAVLEDATIREGLRKVDVRFSQPVLIRD